MMVCPRSFTLFATSRDAYPERKRLGSYLRRLPAF